MLHLPLPAAHKPIFASLDLPGSKSIANRVLPLAALAQGWSTLANVPDVGEDVNLMLQALTKLGIQIQKVSQQDNGCSTYRIAGCGGVLPLKQAEIFCGNSGTCIRFLTALLSLLPGQYLLTGIERMKERPIDDLLQALRQLGANIYCSENEGYPPLQTSSFCDNLTPQVALSGKISSQYLTGLLMALPQLKREITVVISDQLISKPYVAITLALLAKFGVKVSEQVGQRFKIAATTHLTAFDYSIEPDASSASYFLALGALSGSVRVNSLSAYSLQGDKNFARILAQMGAEVEYATDYICCTKGILKGLTVNMEDMPDVAMTIAVMALFALGTTRIDGIASWKVKETDRLLAMYNELTKLGALVSYTSDSITITPPKQVLANVAIETYNDHRMAMCFSLVAAAGVPVVINNYECVGKTFANYFSLFKQLVY